MSDPPAAETRRVTRRRALAWGVAVGLCCAFGALRWCYRPPLGDGLDGAYYFQIARQVALGHGLQTSYSVFHMGLSPLPQPATSYPLLPLAIGTLARWLPLEDAAVWLPGAAYVASIGLCFAFHLWQTARSVPALAWATRCTFSALFAIWFGLIPVYVWTSARPYTETLANLLVLAALGCFGLCSGASFATGSARALSWGGVGVLAGLCYLARFQLVVVGVAFVLARALSTERRRSRDLACVALGFGLCFGWQAMRLLSLPNANLYALLDFAMYRQLADLPRFAYDLHFDQRSDWLLDKLVGVRESLNPDNDESYFVQLSYLVWLVPFGLAVWPFHQISRWRKNHSQPSFRDPRHAALLASAWVGLLAVLPLHTVHSLHWRSWAFGWRQGMPLMYLIIPIALWLLSSASSVVRAGVAVLLALSIVVCARKSREVLLRHVPTEPLAAYAEVAHYLDTVAPTRGTLGIEHQSLAVFTAQPLYWVACWSPPEFVATLVRELPIDRVLIRAGESRCPSLTAIRSLLRPERAFTSGAPSSLYRIVR